MVNAVTAHHQAAMGPDWRHTRPRKKKRKLNLTAHMASQKSSAHTTKLTCKRRILAAAASDTTSIFGFSRPAPRGPINVEHVDGVEQKCYASCRAGEPEDQKTVFDAEALLLLAALVESEADSEARRDGEHGEDQHRNDRALKNTVSDTICLKVGKAKLLKNCVMKAWSRPRQRIKPMAGSGRRNARRARVALKCWLTTKANLSMRPSPSSSLIVVRLA